MPGMRVMQFGFGDRGAHIYLPHSYEPNSVVYTGTHDNDTTLGWWKNSASEEERIAAATYLNITREEDIAWSLRARARSPRLPIWPLFRCRMCWDWTAMPA